MKGIISARSGDKVQVTPADGAKTVVTINDATKITANKGFLGLNRNRLAAMSLLSGLPVTVQTVQSGSSLVASQISLQNKDLDTASTSMIFNCAAAAQTEGMENALLLVVGYTDSTGSEELN